MILILIAILSLIAASIYLHKSDFNSGFFNEVLSPMFAVIGFTLLIAYAVSAWQYFAAEYKADIINREYQSNYTQLEVYYASDVINTVRELDRKRVEINGDLITGK